VTVSEAPQTKTPLESLLSDTRSFYERVKAGAKAGQPVTQGAFSNFVLNTMLPVLEALRSEYNEGFTAMGELVEGGAGGDDDDDEMDAAEELTVMGQDLIGKLVVFNTVLLQDRGWLTEQGTLAPEAPATIAESFNQLLADLSAYQAAVVEAVEGDDDDEDEDDEVTA